MNLDVPHFKIAQSGLIAILTSFIGQLVAFVPAFAPDKQILISAGSVAIGAAFMIANAVHAVIGSKIDVAELEQGVRGFVHDELGKVDFNAVVRQVTNAKDLPGIEKLVSDEIGQQLSKLATVLAGPSGPTPAPFQPPAPSA